MMAQPFVGERFWSDGERALTARGGAVRPIATRRCAQLSEATLLATTPDMFEGSAGERFAGLRTAVKATRFGTDCYGYAMVAAGQADVVVEAKLATYDIAPFIPILEAAGGRVSDWSGGDALAGGEVIAAGDPRIAEEIVARLAARP
jgi:myo-inositol-1(or 4)-monophosphatase